MSELQVKWMLEPDVFPGDCDMLIEALERLEVPYIKTKFGKPYESYVGAFEDSNVVFYGSFQFAKAVESANWKGYFCNFGKFDCNFYYPIFGYRLLNSIYVMLPYGDLENMRDWLFKIFNTDELFVKPAPGYKEFSGMSLKKDKWTFRYADHNLMAVVAPAVKIGREWRLVVAENKVIEGSQYKDANGKNNRDPRVPKEVVEYGQSVLDEIKYNPDPIWMLDICENKHNGLSVMEVGPFSCCGMYACNAEAVVKKANDIVMNR